MGTAHTHTHTQITTGHLYSQSRCFFLGPLTSCVVALHTALLIADPVMLCWAAAIRSVIDWPDISASSLFPAKIAQKRSTPSCQGEVKGCEFFLSFSLSLICSPQPFKVLEFLPKKMK